MVVAYVVASLPDFMLARHNTTLEDVIKTPASQCMAEPIFFGAIFQSLIKVETVPAMKSVKDEFKAKVEPKLKDYARFPGLISTMRTPEHSYKFKYYMRTPGCEDSPKPSCQWPWKMSTHSTCKGKTAQFKPNILVRLPMYHTEDHDCCPRDHARVCTFEFESAAYISSNTSRSGSCHHGGL